MGDQKEQPEAGKEGRGWVKMTSEFQAGEAPRWRQSCLLSLLGWIWMRQAEVGRFPELPCRDLATAR